MRHALVALFALCCPPLWAQSPHNLLRNGDFQDDWITLLPEMKNHHWCYPYDFYNRRDYNPDTWQLKGKWTWENADERRGQRRVVIEGPAEIRQRVNWVLIHDDRALAGFPDAGGYPVMKSARSKRPERLIRDLELKLLVTGKAVPAKAGSVELAVCPVGGLSGDPLGSLTPPLVVASVPIPGGSYKDRWLEVDLPGKAILEALQAKAAKDPKETPLVAKDGLELPGLVQVLITYSGKEGKLELHQAELTAAENDSPTLLANGGFEEVDEKGYPRFWSAAQKYRYFPPRHYYIFNTWHNTAYPNRGHVAADKLLPCWGEHSLRMVVPSGDETMVLSDPIVLNQTEPRLIEVSAVVRTDRLCMLQIDAVTDDGQRLDGFNWIHKAPVSIGTNGWRTLRQVFRPRGPVKSFRLALCARGVNGYTLDDTGGQPQNDVAGTIWWDNVTVKEPETTKVEFAVRRLKVFSPVPEGKSPNPHLADLVLGAQRGAVGLLTATVFNPGAAGEFSLKWSSEDGASKQWHGSQSVKVAKNAHAVLDVDYFTFGGKAKLTLLRGKEIVAATDVALADAWTPDLQLGALYLAPTQKQFVRINALVESETLNFLNTVEIDVVRVGSGKVEKSFRFDVSRASIAELRRKIPADLRGDLSDLLLFDLDVSFLPLQPLSNPARNWFIRVRISDGKERGKELTAAETRSPPFCRLDHEPPQPPIEKVSIEGNNLFINGKPWMPWGVTYGHNAVYSGPADPGPGKYRDLSNLPEWNLYDRHGPSSTSRKNFDFNCLRYVAGSITPAKVIEEKWTKDNLYCSTAFATPDPVFSLEAAFKKAGGKDKLDAYLTWCRKDPAVVSVTPGIEEAFGLFLNATPSELKGMEEVADYLRKASGKPVMVSHGGYWNRLEFERVPFFDIFDPETEPLFPANLHTDLAPIVKGKNKVVWLRPQMYESIPYERWRFHTYVELMRGARGWQIAHGPGDASTFRGLHGELEFWKPIIASKEPAPKVKIEPWIEHWAGRHKGKTYIMAATTHGIPLGAADWENAEATLAPASVTGSKIRVTASSYELRDETNAYAIGEKAPVGPAIHGIQYLPDARLYPPGSKLVQWVRLDEKHTPDSLAILVKGDGRWTHVAGWGKVDLKTLQDPKTAYWFLNSFYRHAKGFLGWGTDLVPKAMEFVPSRHNDQGKLPDAGKWVELAVPLKDLGVEGKLIDGAGFMHSEGKVAWGRTVIVAPDGHSFTILGDGIGLPPGSLAKVRIDVPGVKKGTRVRVLFEDRDIVAADGFFVDDFRGQDLYQRYGGRTGYGDTPVALHLYEMP